MSELVDGGGIAGGNGTYFANYGDDVHAVGSLDPIVPGYVGCIVIKPDGSRYVARAVPDPLAKPQLTERSTPADVWKRPPRTSFLSAAS